jgi:hypothetical protein
MFFRLVIFLFCFTPLTLIAQDSPKKALKKLGQNPIYIIDSVRVSKKEMLAYDVNQVTLVNMLTDSDAIKRYGLEAADGVVLVESKNFARKRYVRYFRNKSVQYDSLYNIAKTDTTFQYIINNKVQRDNYEGNLALIDDDIFESLEILTAQELNSRYGITDKLIGVLVKSRKPNTLYHAKKSF